MYEDGDGEPIVESQYDRIEYIRWSQIFSTKGVIFPNDFANPGNCDEPKVAKRMNPKWQKLRT